MKKPTVLLLETVSPKAHNNLEQNCHLLISKSPKSGLEIVGNQNVDAIITRGKGQVNKELITACKGLKVIARCGVGLDNVDIETASSLGIKVLNAPGSNADTVAEHTLALILSAQRKIYTSVEEVKNENWGYRGKYDGDEIRGKTLGIIGMGDIGKKVARLASAFGMNILYSNRSKVDTNYKNVHIDILLKESDIISIHLEFNNETKGCLSAESFSKSVKSPILINTSRGGIIEDHQVLSALKNGYISAFAADVLSTEPPPKDSELLKMKNVYITPHSASLTSITFNEMCEMTVENTLFILEGREIDDKFIFNRIELRL
tara:strand:+ start:6819 stop:7775 length:957 start_codon:yes stop_codon:yes gene_type:complete